jgi:hypothetical protein
VTSFSACAVALKGSQIVLQVEITTAAEFLGSSYFNSTMVFPGNPLKSQMKSLALEIQYPDLKD